MWWLVVATVGWCALPMTTRLFPMLPGKGIAVSKLVGLVVLAFGRGWIGFYIDNPGLDGATVSLWAFLALGVFAVLAAWAGRRQLADFLREHKKTLLWQEALFVACFLGYLWMRSFFADATFDAHGWYGAEKWPNLTMLTALWRQGAIPPEDTWLLGFPLNYYYFSHLTWATVCNLSMAAPEVGFNLALATFFSLQIFVVYYAGRVLLEKRAAGFWAVFLVVFAGPLVTWQQWPSLFSGLPDWGPERVLAFFSFWAPSDVLPATRNEFPAFHWLLGDLHAHGMGLLLLLLALLTAVQAQRMRELEALPWSRLLVRQPLWVLWTLVLLAAMWMTNAWDLMVFGALVGGWLLAESAAEWQLASRLTQLFQGGLLWLAMALLAVVCFAAFYTFFMELPISNPGENDWLSALSAWGLVGPDQRTRPGEYFLFWGLLLAPAAALFIARGKNLQFWSRVAIVGGAAVLALEIAGWAPGFPIVGLLVALGVLALLVQLFRESLDGRMEGGRLWLFLLLSAGLLAQAVPEFFFLDDPIGPPYQRYNTVFKLYYCSWGLMGLAVAGILSGMQARWAELRRRVLFFALAGWVVVMGGLYPVLAPASRMWAGGARMARWRESGVEEKTVQRTCRTLDGLAFMALPTYYPDDHALALWMREHLPAGARLAEAVDGSYNVTGRFATITGFPCVLGWPSHQSQWRGEMFSGKVAGSRMELLEKIYAGSSPEESRKVCEALGVEWVVYGALERDQYGQAGLEHLQRFAVGWKSAGASRLFHVSARGKAVSRP